MKRKKGVSVIVKRMEYTGRCVTQSNGVFAFFPMYYNQWHRAGFPKLKPGESCKVKVTIERVK